ncbi:hypothetical protein [Actinoallomurus rhizosphaericola]|uniref:hypothetical protein n=1 Tax=Actinoallomurus rhizosphaericola TaxID=2952536 RepID=UPI002090E0B9|nr:hypothetical protein [Actinoallomurus rhizosphaericola]MCO5992859.1 hypothetical protein [Actinoallomurus rhizosphaericola]
MKRFLPLVILFSSFMVALVLAITACNIARKVRPMGRIRRPKFKSIPWLVMCATISVAFYFVVGIVASPSVALSYGGNYIEECIFDVDTLMMFAGVLYYFDMKVEAHPKVVFAGVAIAIAARTSCVLLQSIVSPRFPGILYIGGAATIVVAYRAVIHEQSDEPRAVVHARRIENKLSFLSRWASSLVPVVTLGLADPVAWSDGSPVLSQISAISLALLLLPAVVSVAQVISSRVLYLGKGFGVVVSFTGVKIVLQGMHSAGFPEVPVIESRTALAMILVSGAIVIAASHVKYVRSQDRDIES